MQFSEARQFMYDNASVFSVTRLARRFYQMMTRLVFHVFCSLVDPLLCSN